MSTTPTSDTRAKYDALIPDSSRDDLHKTSSSSTMTEPYTAASQEAPAKRKLNDTDVAQEKRARRDTFDDDWSEFQRTVVAPLREPQPSYAHATISAEPELHATLTQDPKDVQSSKTERRSHIEQATREDILARIEEEERAQEEAGERIRILRARLARIKQARRRPRDASLSESPAS
ncbi:uncharacterized protein MRET_2679 [Malassezia restricta]|uniref:uncharacterized protein n=1 Tax=Malassezia restricta TaxID=76775 RepID=UPI000DD180F2|nr:uncharacterized protein MRET_2679 [Malassezia restricta]AXA50557.1 uncharacterized protein MRET_2679 [Malassezia restricta]